MQEKLIWYPKDATCTSIEIEDYAEAIDKKPVRRSVSTDMDFIHRVKTYLDKMPVEGDMYVSFSPDVSLIVARLICDSRPAIIEFYNGRVKTPGTSFYASGSSIEDALLKLLQSELDKEVNKAKGSSTKS